MFLRSAAIALALCLPLIVLCQPTATAAPGTIATIPLPKRAKLLPSKDYRSPFSFRKTLMFYKRYLKRNKHPFTQIPTYQARGIIISRFLSKAPESPWIAIQIYKERGRVQIFIVPRPQKNTPLTPQSEKNPSAP